jgi:hypothetical protein
MGLEVAQAYRVEGESYTLQDEAAKIYGVIPRSNA